ncbi:MAG: cell division protein ZapE [Magnetococcales bacterium]|nr:cell division protein ZapE [Magnetococcales bacterium]
MSQTMMKIPSVRYQEQLAQGTLTTDQDQSSALPYLDQLVTALSRPCVLTSYKGVMVWRYEDGEPEPRGLYLHGPVGRGKSMLMQLVFDSVVFQEKRRVHFHPFLDELHHRLHKAKPEVNVDVMLYIASNIAVESRLLCFDEFFIDHIADGMLLGRLLDALFQCGVTLCATSNWDTENLFKGGYNRASFLPLLKVITSHVEPLDLSSGADWRRKGGALASLKGGSPEEDFFQLTQTRPSATRMTLGRHDLALCGKKKGICWFDFRELCVRNLGAADYMDLAKTATTVMISGIPDLRHNVADSASRFVILVDMLYESRIPLRLYSDLEFDELCPEGPVAFEFRRAVSRCHELMRLNGVV